MGIRKAVIYVEDEGEPVKLYIRDVSEENVEGGEVKIGAMVKIRIGVMGTARIVGKIIDFSDVVSDLGKYDKEILI